jgi:hypothetical protein
MSQRLGTATCRGKRASNSLETDVSAGVPLDFEDDDGTAIGTGGASTGMMEQKRMARRQQM